MQQNRRVRLLAIITNGLDGAALHSLGAGGNLLVCHRLLFDKGQAFVVIAGEEVGSRFAAEITVDAVAINVELARNILFCFFVDIGHSV